MNQSRKMKLLLRSLLLSALCALSSWSVSSDTLVVSQSPDVSVLEGETVNISCCWNKTDRRVGIKWLKNQTTIKNKTILNQSSDSLKEQARSCSFLILSNITNRDSGSYICKVSVEIPVLTEAEGKGTTITVTARGNTSENSAKESRGPPSSLPLPVMISLAVLAPLFLVALVCFCSLRRKQVQAARVIYEVPHTDSMDAEMDKHSTTSSRGSTQWCQVPVYDSLDYFEQVESKGSG
ncbi:uncharacterized protein LOC108239384 isoform X2 [Kryptolebias marmoratus]|uniref:uncharacterized protein LOC108239384 isoform X2 n=1 Tax=Kryptolebias marmoratus TaxID=37003 RepID=UPI000D5306CD|nr:uncharacterized protein LOC108239384 isoform X2 [Kryptolebias marmoratus]